MATKDIPIVGDKAKLLSRVEVAEGTMTFHFEKPSQFAFKPGRFADVTLSNPPDTDSEGNTRTLSIASSGGSSRPSGSGVGHGHRSGVSANGSFIPSDVDTR
jgi:hypothetical protein